MGEGGSIVLINATPYTWQSFGQASFQMDSWNWPATVQPMTSQSVYVEWDQSVLNRNQQKDVGIVYFELPNTGNVFSILANGSPTFGIYVKFDNLTTQNNPQGSLISLGWAHDGTMPFILSGNSGNFWSTNPPTSWMHDMLPIIGTRNLREIVIPGSHDSGMSKLTGSTVGGVTGNVLTQSLSIGGQLSMGARYFDIRPVITNGQYATGHYSNTHSPLGWQGGNGQMMDDVISDINSFTATNPELIILNLSHDYDTDAANSNYLPFTQAQWNSLFDKFINKLNGLYVSHYSAPDLSKTELQTFIGEGKAAVLVICQVEDGITLGNYVRRGFYPYPSFNVTNLYSGVANVNAMANDQFGKMSKYHPTWSSLPFLLSWTLTQAVSNMAQLQSIISLANTANSQIYTMLPPRVTSSVYPNIVYVDNYASSDITALSIALNFMVNPPPMKRSLPARYNLNARKNLGM